MNKVEFKEIKFDKEYKVVYVPSFFPSSRTKEFTGKLYYRCKGFITFIFETREGSFKESFSKFDLESGEVKIYE